MWNEPAPDPPCPPGAQRSRAHPGPPAESPDGIDLTLIQYTLSLTPMQRLELLQDWVDGLAELRRGRIGKVEATDANGDTPAESIR